MGRAGKRDIVLNKFKKLNSIILLQETHSTTHLEKAWEETWKGKMYFSHRDSQSRGVAILFPEGFDFELCEQKIDLEGRMIIIKVKIESNYYVICNIYAPCQGFKLDQNNFILKIKNELAPFMNDNIVLGGDFNFYTNPKLDKLDSMSNKNDNPFYRAEVKVLLESMNLTDCFRDLHENLRRYTWHSRGKSSRLDYFFISEHLLNELYSYKIQPGLHSDHSILDLKIGNDTNLRGKGFWKFNISLLRDPVYVGKVKGIIQKCEHDYATLEDKGLVWEVTKMEIRSFTLPYCVKKKKERSHFKQSMEQEMVRIQELLDAHPTEQNQEFYQATKKELEQIEKDELNSQIFRSKIQWTEEGEKNSKFFLGLEKRNYLNKLITHLEIDGKNVTDINKISDETAKFYKQLYSEKLNNFDSSYQENLDLFLENNMPKLNEDQKHFCDKAISESEILKSIKLLANGKTPGSDGLPADWYKFFWVDIKHLLCNSITYAMDHGELSIEQKRGIITLLPKKNKNRTFLRNWRPISLLNTDYKIIAKVLANRMQQVLPSIIHQDQSGYLKGRYIGQNIRILEDVSFFTKHNNIPGMLLSIDFEKAFDSLNWNFLFQTLHHVNFGSSFVKYVKTMYTNIESTVINNGSAGNFFKLQRGVRQGCPLSAYLFILSLETLANKIRNDKNIKGIKIGDQEIKIVLLADDITLILSDLSSVEHSIKILKAYSKCAGLKINVEKTQAKYIGSLKDSDYFPHGLSWIKTPIETLGIIITDDVDKCFKYNFQQKIHNLKSTLNIWKQRSLSIKGKITVINNLALASLIYTASVVDTPKKAITEINNILQNFIWDGKTSKIAQQTLIQEIAKGGLKLCHFETKIKALKLSWVKRLYIGKDANWTILPSLFYTTTNLEQFFKGNHPLTSKHLIPNFYLDIYKLYSKYFKLDPTDLTQILNQPLWANSYITVNNKSIHVKEWEDKGITQLKHILDRDCNFFSHSALKNTYNINTHFLLTAQIISSIPKSWKATIKKHTKFSDKIPEDYTIYINKIHKSVQDTTCKDFYWHIINAQNYTPISIFKWCEYYNTTYDTEDHLWANIFKSPFRTVRETKIQSFQLKLLHRITSCNKWLFNIKIKDSDKCSYCNNVDDIPHFFINCPKVLEFWGYWFNWWERVTNIQITNINCIKQRILFGFIYPPADLKEKFQVLDYCILYTKYYIYIQRLYKNNLLDLHACLVQIKSALETEKEICIKNNNISNFDKYVFLYDNM
jgi:exonuclease III